jgi:hypothetical protein
MDREQMGLQKPRREAGRSAIPLSWEAHSCQPYPATIMKIQTLLFIAVMTSTAWAIPAAEDAKSRRIGTYDSRVVAYAHFWSEGFQRQQQELMAGARATKTSGDKGKFKKLEAQIEQQQAKSHLQVFSTAPAEEALAALKDRLPQIQKEAKVDLLVSKWDEAALRQLANAEKVDVTDRLAREFKPKEQQLKVIESIKTQKPLPLEECKELIKKGEI